jgi:succinate dehydrogenase/fumarate reductase flavoprotein subunit
MKQLLIETDVLVVGGGGAGFRAAIAAREKGARVVLLSKGPMARCGASPMAGADFTLDGTSMNKLGREGDPNDTMEKVFNDIVTQGYYLNNQILVEQYVQRAPRLLKDLLDWGIDVKMSDERMIFTSGTGIMDVLLRKALAVGVECIEDIMLLDLLVQDGKVTGALGLDVRQGEFVVIKTKSVVMATGGWHKAFWPNTGMRDLSGEGIAMAHRAGADIGNMEFITFCCNIMYEPPMWRGSLAAYMLSMICGGQLTNNKEEDILADYDPYILKVGTSTEWNKSLISHVSALQNRQGKAHKNGGVHYRRGDVSWDFMKMVAAFVFPEWKYKAMNLEKWGNMLEANEPIEVGPAVEYFEGGIVINNRFETAIEGVYAAGECALGVFGANRVFSAITEMLVHGLDAGENAALFAAVSSVTDIDQKMINELEERYLDPIRRKDGTKPSVLRREIQEKAHAHLGPIRNAVELQQFLDYLLRVKKDNLPYLATDSKERTYNKEWIDAIEVYNLVHLLEASVKSALCRKESRGVHFREDYAFTDNDNWLRESVVKLNNGDLTVEHRPVTATSMTLPSGNVPYFEMMKKMMESHSDTGGKH